LLGVHKSLDNALRIDALDMAGDNSGYGRASGDDKEICEAGTLPARESGEGGCIAAAWIVDAAELEELGKWYEEDLREADDRQQAEACRSNCNLICNHLAWDARSLGRA
jgi:hypothetical protein